MKAKINYQGSHTHPSQDSSAKDVDGVIVVKHRIDLRQGYILTALKAIGLSSASEIADKLNATFPEGGYGVNHVTHALNRLRRDYGAVECIGQKWNLTANARAKFDRAPKNVRKPR